MDSRDFTNLRSKFRFGQAASNGRSVSQKQAGHSAMRSVGSRAAVSRSGLWLLAGTVVLAAAVLVWAFGNEPLSSTSAPKPPAGGGVRHATAPARHLPARTARPAKVAAVPKDVARIAMQPPAVAEYAPLLRHDVFAPLVAPPPPKPTKTGGLKQLAGPGDNGGAWHGWKFDGLAQLGDVTYALIEQPDKGTSHFLKVGDQVEDAKVLKVSSKELVLAEAGGGEVHVPRVDAMAELMHASRPRPTVAAQPPPGGAPTAVGTPAAPGAPTTSAPPPVLPSAGGGNDVRALSDPNAGSNNFGGGRRGRRRGQVQGTE